MKCEADDVANRHAAVHRCYGVTINARAARNDKVICLAPAFGKAGEIEELVEPQRCDLPCQSRSAANADAGLSTGRCSSGARLRPRQRHWASWGTPTG